VGDELAEEPLAASGALVLLAGVGGPLVRAGATVGDFFLSAS